MLGGAEAAGTWGCICDGALELVEGLLSDAWEGDEDKGGGELIAQRLSIFVVSAGMLVFAARLGQFWPHFSMESATLRCRVVVHKLRLWLLSNFWDHPTSDRG